MHPNQANWVLCGHVTESNPPCARPKILRLTRIGHDANVYIAYGQINNLYWGNVSPRLIDLIAIAAYVYSADQAIRRGKSMTHEYGDDWRRQFYFRIEVRDIAFWQMPTVDRALKSLLSFLTDDMYSFEFTPWQPREYADQIIELDFDHCPVSEFDEVMLFSGGLDSLAGAIHLAKKEKCRAVWVKHESNPKYHRQHQQLAHILNQQLGSVMGQYVPVSVYKGQELTVEPIQRSRSFLFGTLAMSIASFMKKKRILFFENGVVSLNLPLSTHVVGARATRTTHPRTLAGLSELFSLVLDERFDVVNPFANWTKTEVIKSIVDHGCGSLISKTTSCAHPRQASKVTPHCGVCSQCIDRRFAVIAANAQQDDPLSGYAVELTRGSRTKITDQTMLASYTETGLRYAQMSERDFWGHYGEAARAIRYGSSNFEENARRIFELHRRHGQQIQQAVRDILTTNIDSLIFHSYQPASLLRMINACDVVESNSVGGSDQNTPLGPNVLVREGDGWRIRFRNRRSFFLKQIVGLSYLRCLLQSPRTSVHTSEILRMIDHHERPDEGSPSQLDENLTEIGLLQSTLQDLRAEQEQARQDQDLAMLNRLDPLINDTQSRLSELLQQRRYGVTSKQAKRDYNRVSKGIQTAIEKIGEYDRHLYEHLSGDDLQRGQTWFYTPPEGVVWET